MVAASATAILNDIKLSTFLGHPFRGPKFGKPRQSACRSHATHF